MRHLRTSPRKPFIRRAQTAIEYLLLLSAVVAVVLVAMKSLFWRTTSSSSDLFDKVSYGIMGNQAGYYNYYNGGDYVDVWKARTSRHNYP